MKDKTIIISALIIVLIYLAGLSVVVYKWEKEYKNCRYEEYMEYPCEGATHYARVHRNNNEACERTKKICEEV